MPTSRNPRPLIVAEYYREKVVSFLDEAVELPWTNMPAALTEFFGGTTRRQVTDLLGFTQFRLVAEVGAVGVVAAAYLTLQYSPDNVVAYATAAHANAGNAHRLVLTAGGLLVGSWNDLVYAACVDSVYLRIVGTGGDGAVDPTFFKIRAEFRN